MLMIVEEKNKLPKNWNLELPDFDSHLDDIGHIEDDEELLLGIKTLSHMKE